MSLSIKGQLDKECTTLFIENVLHFHYHIIICVTLISCHACDWVRKIQLHFCIQILSYISQSTSTLILIHFVFFSFDFWYLPQDKRTLISTSPFHSPTKNLESLTFRHLIFLNTLFIHLIFYITFSYYITNNTTRGSYTIVTLLFGTSEPF